jgi:post-segregation antitoxin (ccd killing protein)
MIVSDDTVSKALAYLAEDPHPLAAAQKAELFAEKQKNEAFAEIYLDTDGTAKERESKVLINSIYREALDAEIEAQAEVSRHKRRTDAAEKIISVWQTENANARAAERVR